ncbi:ThuA domain-containing protein [Muriicola sp. SD30]|uniref:ThuA domain-containing protein n=1 Tax=Muriicola sp. SD30 TaxID=3240936 RepID=UPI00350F7E9F
MRYLLFLCLTAQILLFGCQQGTKNTGDSETLAEVIEITPEILVFTKTEGYRHKAIEKGVRTLQELSKESSFSVTQTENSNDFNKENLAQYSLVIFLSTTLDVLNEEQQQAFTQYINQGGNYMGVHAATDTEYDWPWYGKLAGAYFKSHPEQQEATINVVDRAHASTAHLGETWVHFDEWYNFKELNPDVKVLMQLDESSYSGGENGDFHPIAWYHEYEGGRSFYTGLGHTEESYDDPDFQKHLLGGIFYCLGRDK